MLVSRQKATRPAPTFVDPMQARIVAKLPEGRRFDSVPGHHSTRLTSLQRVEGSLMAGHPILRRDALSSSKVIAQAALRRIQTARLQLP